MQPESLIRTLRQLFSFASSVCLLVDCPDFLQSYKIRVMRTRARTAHGLTENLATWEELRQATRIHWPFGRKRGEPSGLGRLRL